MNGNPGTRPMLYPYWLEPTSWAVQRHNSAVAREPYGDVKSCTAPTVHAFVWLALSVPIATAPTVITFDWVASYFASDEWPIPSLQGWSPIGVPCRGACLRCSLKGTQPPSSQVFLAECRC